MNPQNIAALGVSQLNTSLQNSGISYSDLSFTLAGTALVPGYIEVSNLRSAFDSLEANTKIVDLRRDYQADLVILLTATPLEQTALDGTVLSSAVLGGARFNFIQQNGSWVPNSERWRCLINAGPSSSFFHFQHEIAHLFGCHHDNQVDFSAIPGFPNDQRAKKFTTRTCRRCGVFFTCCTNNERQTIVASDAKVDKLIPHFSNPAISFEGVPTGEIGFRNNARLLKEYACHISNYVTSTPPMTVSISGQNNCNTNEYYTWCANVSNCVNVTNFNWEISTNGIDYMPFGNVGNGSCVFSSVPSGSYFGYLRVTAICNNGNSVTNYFPFNINEGNPYIATQNVDSLNANKIRIGTPQLFDNENVVVSPNPSSDKVRVSIKTEESNTLLVTLQDLTGKTLKSIMNTNVFQGILQFELDVKELSNGIYLIRTQSDSKTITHKLVIQK